MRHNRHELQLLREVANSYGVPFYFDTAIFACLPHGDNAARANEVSKPTKLNDIPVQMASATLTGMAAGSGTLLAPLEQRLDPKRAAQSHLSDPRQVEEMADLYLRTRELPADARLYRCSAAQSTVHVDPYGNLQPCTISTNGGHNIRDGGFAKGWHGPLAEVRKMKAREGSSCQSCDKQALCAGCPAFFAAESGDGSNKSDYVCETTHLIVDGLKPTIDARLASRSQERP